MPLRDDERGKVAKETVSQESRRKEDTRMITQEKGTELGKILKDYAG